ncbi:MAG TPA: ABC transporter ATP-binding protein, partial [Thermoplasmata archaeon]|nr:ABC transporter ATP-binding protein [Thermoplasmata archaeon]
TEPSGGSAWVLDEPVPPRGALSKIGYMPQDVAIYPDLTVEENLRLFGRLLGLAERAIPARIESVLHLVEILDRKEELVSNLSGGMKRRTSLAAALLHDPELLLLDEPTVGVDPELRATFWEYFGEITRRGRTVVITTHYMEEAARCDRVALLHHGRLLALGAPAELKRRTSSSNLDDAFLALVRAEGATS